MNHLALRGTATAFAVLVLSACGGGGNASGLSCTSLAPLLDGPNSDSSCTGSCSVENLAGAADGQFGSASLLRMDGTAAGSVAVSAHSTGGGVFVVGTIVGVIYEVGESTQRLVSYQLNTYLAGIPQDSFTIRIDNEGSFGSAPAHYANLATRPYDSVEFRYLRGSGSVSGTARAYEFCSD